MCGFRLIFLQRLKVATSKLAGWWALQRPIKNFHEEEKEGVVLGYGSSQKFGVFPLIFMQWLKVSTSRLVHSLGGQLGPS